jgi:hypothetical protein
MDYAIARRHVRKLLGEKAELRELRGSPVPIFKYVVGMMDKGKFLPLEAGSSWDDVVRKLNERMEKTKS